MMRLRNLDGANVQNRSVQPFISQETLERELKIRPSQPGRIVSLLPNLSAWFDANQAVDGDRCLIFHPWCKHWSDFHANDFIGNWYADRRRRDLGTGAKS
jgi:hypothetical protein